MAANTEADDQVEGRGEQREKKKRKSKKTKAKGATGVGDGAGVFRFPWSGGGASSSLACLVFENSRSISTSRHLLIDSFDLSITRAEQLANV